MSYSNMKSKIEGELTSEPARIAAHVGVTLRVTLAGRVAGDAVTPASREPSTLWGEAGRRGVGRAVADRPVAPMLAPPLGWGARAGSRGGERHIPHCGGRHPSSRRVSSELTRRVSSELATSVSSELVGLAGI
jgi:hypothetical protein